MGSSWTPSAQCLRGLGPIRRNGEYHHFDPMGNAGVITNSSGAVLSSDLYDSFDVPRYTQGSAQTPQRPSGLLTSDEGLLRDQTGATGYLPNRNTRTAVPAIGIIIIGLCLAACAVELGIGIIEEQNCAKTTCKNQKGAARDLCLLNCTAKALLTNPVDFAFTAACAFCICEAVIKNPVKCYGFVKKLLQTITKSGAA